MRQRRVEASCANDGRPAAPRRSSSRGRSSRGRSRPASPARSTRPPSVDSRAAAGADHHHSNDRDGVTDAQDDSFQLIGDTGVDCGGQGQELGVGDWRKIDRVLERATLVVILAGVLLRAVLGFQHFWAMEHPDEVHQILEVAHVLAFGTGTLPPEYQQPGNVTLRGVDGSVYGPIGSLRSCRSPLIPIAVASFIRAGNAIGVSYSVLLPITRAGVAAVGGLTAHAASKLGNQLWQSDTHHHRFAVLILCTILSLHPFMVETAVRTYVQATVTPFALYAVAGMCDLRTYRKRLKLLLSGGIAGAVTYVRPDAALLLACGVALLGMGKLRHNQLWLAGTGGLGAIVCLGWLDGAYYGTFGASPINWVRFNVIDGWAFLSGEQAWHMYALHVIADPLHSVAAALILVPSHGTNTLAYSRPKLVAFVEFWLLVLAFSRQLHKEMRFLHGAYVLLAIAAADGAKDGISVVLRVVAVPKGVPPTTQVKVLSRCVWNSLLVGAAASFVLLSLRPWTRGAALNIASWQAAQQGLNCSVAVFAAWPACATGTFLHATAHVPRSDSEEHHLELAQRAAADSSICACLVPIDHHSTQTQATLQQSGFQRSITGITGSAILFYLRSSSNDSDAQSRPVFDLHLEEQSTVVSIAGLQADTIGTFANPLLRDWASRSKRFSRALSCIQSLELQCAASNFSLTLTELPDSHAEVVAALKAVSYWGVGWTHQMAGQPAEALAAYQKGGSMDQEGVASSRLLCWCHAAYNAGSMGLSWWLCSLAALLSPCEHRQDAHQLLGSVMWQQGITHPISERWAHSLDVMRSIEMSRRKTHLFARLLDAVLASLAQVAQSRGNISLSCGMQQQRISDKGGCYLESGIGCAENAARSKQSVEPSDSRWLPQISRLATTQEAKTLARPGLCRLAAARDVPHQPSHRTQRIRILTLFDSNVMEQSSLSVPQFKAFALAHGYSFASHNGTLAIERPTAWSKIQMLLNHLESEEGNRTDWLLWVDVDMVITNMSHSLDVFLPADKAIDFVVQADMHMTMNTGVFFLRKTRWSIEFLRKVYNHTVSLTSPFWENDAMVKLYHADASIRAKTMVLPYGTLQALPPHAAASTAFVHFAGGANRHESMLDIRRGLAPQHAAQMSAVGLAPLQLVVANRPRHVTFASAIVPVHHPDDSDLMRSAKSTLVALRKAMMTIKCETEAIFVLDGNHAQHVEDDLAEYCAKYNIGCTIHAGGGASRGAGWARNKGVELSQGTVLLFNDDDDVWFPDHAIHSITALEVSPQVAFAKTHVRFTDRLDDHWTQAIENSLVINLSVKKEAFQFVGGFLELPGAGGEDSALNSMLVKFFVGRRVDVTTVEYIRKPGCTFDKQLWKFQRSPEHEQQYIEATGDGYNAEYARLVNEQEEKAMRELRRHPHHGILHSLLTQAYKAYSV